MKPLQKTGTHPQFNKGEDREWELSNYIGSWQHLKLFLQSKRTKLENQQHCNNRRKSISIGNGSQLLMPSYHIPLHHNELNTLAMAMAWEPRPVQPWHSSRYSWCLPLQGWWRVTSAATHIIGLSLGVLSPNTIILKKLIFI